MSQRTRMLMILAGVAALAHPSLMLRAQTVPAQPPENEIAKKSEAKRMNDLVAQLGNREFAAREEATKALIAAGARALEVVQKAGMSSDAEVRRRAGLILARIEKDIDTDRLLKPKRIRLVYRDTPITEAVADFSKKSGYPLQFEGDRVRLATRKITLDTGDVTFWEALEQFCRAAALREQHGPRPANVTTQPINQRDLLLADKMQMMRQLRGIALSGTAMSPPRVDFGRIVLLEGRESLPMSQSGGVRMRILRPGTPIPGHARSSEEAVLALEVAPEPGIDWRGVLDARVEKAIDINGREVKQILETQAQVNNSLNEWDCVAGVVFNAGGNNVVAWDLEGENAHYLIGPPPREVPIRLKLNERETQLLHEIRGTLVAQVQSPHEPIIRADRILEAEGKTFKGPDGSFLKIHEVKRIENGQIKLQLTLRAPLSTGADGLAMMQGAIFVRRFNGKMAFMAQQEGEMTAAQKFALQDSKCQNYHLASSEVTNQVNGMEMLQEMRLIYQCKQGLGEPAHLIYSGQRLVTVEIPFVFKNVPVSE